ncbi:helix-turn-helix domain-containing protein [Alkaliphilus peptidifermentans]|uniref:Helix-turn-helix domain-containing protein n=1 Tax=Alkaliphilus peptidifermentans DSM 18978 TaxID=1120976 RepID=A0A1G5HRV0_9FIRM|nr:helix-turn-helix transcriptional regulator [Alkaliphilus peptidifermentans]SCY66411.1 Helix-turn-helix domain-containing protein [Alkaliphilus peptidifermentans DSM 18978]
MEIVAPGERIRRIRKKIGLKQDDLTSDKITRSLISMIENGKRSLTKDTAAIIVEKFNRHNSLIGQSITVEYLMETEVYQAKAIVDKQLKEVELLVDSSSFTNPKVIFDFMDKSLEIIDYWSLEEYRSKFFLLQGKVYYSIYQYNNASISYHNALEYFLLEKNYNMLAFVYNEIGKCNYMQFHLDNAVYYYNKAYKILEGNKHKVCKGTKLRILFNIILAYYKTKQYETALKFINKYRALSASVIEANLGDDLLLIESTIYRELGNNENAERIYNVLLNRKDQLRLDTLALLYAKISIHHRKLQNHHKALYYIRKAFELKHDITPLLLPNIYLQLVEYHISLRQYNAAIIILNETKSISEKLSNNEGIIDVYFTFASVYMRINGGASSAEAYLKKAEEVILCNSNIVKGKLQQLYSHYAELYYITQDTLKFNYYIERIRNFSVF